MSLNNASCRTWVDVFHAAVYGAGDCGFLLALRPDQYRNKLTFNSCSSQYTRAEPPLDHRAETCLAPPTSSAAFTEARTF